MASEVPLCLIENVKGHLIANQKALEILSTITQPVVVVAIMGLYRTGKSYLMNRLAGKRTGFCLGSTVQSKTKGIWMWCVPHPQKPNHNLVLLDTEGLGDVEKGDNQNDCWIFALAILLSSTFVYNSMGVINQQAMDQLHYVAELTDRIRVKSSPDHSDGVEDSAEFVSFFPDFVWTLRDVTLRLEADGQSLTADEYLENSLKLKKGSSEEDKNYNLPRLCIRKFFPKRKCFVFYPPAQWKKLSELECLHDDELDSDFVKQAEDFCSFIFSSSKAKTLPGGIKVNGAQLGILVQNYVDAIGSGTVPCLENAVTTLAKCTNSAAVQKAADYYSEQMRQRLRLPTDTLQELLDVHAACEKEAIAVFMEHSFKDDEREFQKRLVATIEERKEEFMLRNEVASIRHCQAELAKLSESLRESISHGAFVVPGGHSLYLDARKKVEPCYKQVPRKEVKVTIEERTEEFMLQNEAASIRHCQAELEKLSESLRESISHGAFFVPGGHSLYLEARKKAKEVLKSFLQSQAIMEDSILQSDKALTDGERAIAAERTKKDLAEKERELLRQRQKEQEQVMEAQERSFRENIAKLQEKMEREREMLLKEQEKMLEHKLKVQEELLTEGFRKKSDMLKNEISQLRDEIERTRKQSSGFAHILDTVRDTFLMILPGAGKLCGAGLKVLSSLMK